MASSPDEELEIMRLGERRIIALARGGEPPDRVAGNVYMFDEDQFDGDEGRERLDELRREARRMAAVLGAPAAPVAGDPGVIEARWRVSDTASPKFGERV